MATQPVQAGVEVAAGDFEQAVGVEQQGETGQQGVRGVRPTPVSTGALGEGPGDRLEPQPGQRPFQSGVIDPRALSSARAASGFC